VSNTPYRRDEQPAYPALRIRLTCAGGTHVCHAKVDTGVSRTCVPAEVLHAVGAVRGLPALLTGYAGEVTATWTYYLRVEVIEPDWPDAAPRQFDDIEVCAIGEAERSSLTEVLIGRDLLRNWALLLDGPHEVLELRG